MGRSDEVVGGSEDKGRGVVSHLEMALKFKFQESSMYCALMGLYEGHYRKQPSKILYILQWLK